MLIHIRSRIIHVAAGFAAAMGLPAGVHAQAQQSVQTAVEEVLVTARRREESLQDVPIAISAFGGAELAERGVDTVANMNAIAPNLSVMGGGNQGESQATFRVRGMPGVAVYIDGVNQDSTDGLLTMSVVEVDRIEVLRGPQGTLFGNASLGGALSYVTRTPADSFGARVQASLGSFNRRDMQAAVDIPFSETFKTKLTVASMSRDGFVDSVVIDRSYGDVNDELVRADFLWKPTDSFSARYNVEQSNTDRNGPARVVWEIGPASTFLAGTTLNNTNPQVQAYANAFGINYNTFNNASGQGGALGKYETRVAWETDGLVVDMLRHTLDLSWDINDTFRVRAISGYKELYRSAQIDFDGASEVTIFERDGRIKRYDFSQEMQLLGSHEKVDWVLGAFYQQTSQRNRQITWVMPEFTCDLWNANNRQRVTAAQQSTCRSTRAAALGLPATASNAQLAAANLNGVTNSTFSGAAGANNDQMNVVATDSRAAFGDITWRLTDKLSVAAGLRYSEDNSDAAVNLVNNTNLASRALLLPDNDIPNYFGFQGEFPAATGVATTYDALTKRLTLQYQFNPDLMAYVGYSDGYGPGATSNLNASVRTYMASIENGLVSDVPLNVEREEQTVKNYEIGLRADWLGGALRTNVTVFYTDWTNVDVNQYVATIYWDTNGNNRPDATIDVDGVPGPDVYYFPNFTSVGAAKAIAQGIEFESVWRLTQDLRLNLNIGWLDTEYKELGQAGEGVVPAVTLGSSFASAPEFTGNLAVQYEYGFGGGKALLPRIDYTYTDDYVLATGASFQRTQEGYGMLNARITYDSGSNWNIALTGSNLTNEYYFNSGFYTRSEQIHFMTVGRPTEWGLTFNFRFE